MIESKNKSYRFKEFFDEDSWRRSAKGQEERAWWFNHCHAETENRWRNKKGTQNFFCCDDADESIMRFGKFFVDDETDKPVEPNYVASLLKSWGDPSDLNKKKKVRESEDTVDIYQVVRDSDIKSSLGDDVSNIEPQVVSEFDCKDCAEDKANELNSTVTPGEKAVLGTEYSVQKKDIELKEAESVGPYYAVVNYGNIGSPIYAHGPYDTKEEAQARAKFIRRTFGSYERYCHAWCRVMTQKDIDRANRMGYGYKIQTPKKRVTESRDEDLQHNVDVSIYDEVCRVLTEYEMNGQEETDGVVIPPREFNKIFYDLLVKVQKYMDERIS